MKTIFKWQREISNFKCLREMKDCVSTEVILTKWKNFWLSVLWKTTSLHKKCGYSVFFWFVFPRIRTEYGEILHASPYSVQMQDNTDQKNSQYKHFLRSVLVLLTELTHFSPVLHFYTPWKRQKTKGFWSFQGCRNVTLD